MSLMEKKDVSKFQKFWEIIKLLESNLYFTEFLPEHFATDDMLEPALLVVSDALRLSPDLGKCLWGRSAVAALLYITIVLPNVTTHFPIAQNGFRPSRFSPCPPPRP